MLKKLKDFLTVKIKSMKFIIRPIFYTVRLLNCLNRNTIIATNVSYYVPTESTKSLLTSAK